MMPEESVAEGVLARLEKGEDVGDVLASVRKHDDDPLWDSWWVWSALITVLCAEWIIRKRAGLP